MKKQQAGKKQRSVRTKRVTRETDISLQLNVDGSGVYAIDTGMPFLNHMLELFAKHALFDLKITAKGDLDVDYHHTVEDIGLVLGEALDKALGDRVGISRYGWSMVPMDEALSRVAVDLGGRPYFVCELAVRKRKILDFDLSLLRHFLESFAQKGRMNLHIEQPYGQEAHHAYESVFKGIARALRMACAIDPRVKGVPSSKGRL